ncbi:type II toxin-antitoxin system VapB family antitoxin [Prosthecobacter sp. SYSU 5D2]|uniref:type II toxin-antitoxin system VapB family antitoxin n=1 Tax=Prosthecobacter sp. SYSU 5D2 TaxID=3134134 RepID=UPI0031FEFBC3
MKTTIEIDEEKLGSIMRMTGISTMKEAVDWALNEAVRIATINHIMENPWSPEEARNAVDPDYDIIAIRNSSVPVKYQKKPRAKSK